MPFWAEKTTKSFPFDTVSSNGCLLLVRGIWCLVDRFGGYLEISSRLEISFCLLWGWNVKGEVLKVSRTS